MKWNKTVVLRIHVGKKKKKKLNVSFKGLESFTQTFLPCKFLPGHILGGGAGRIRKEYLCCFVKAKGTTVG